MATPPHSLEQERALIGACLIDPDRIPIVAQILAPTDLYGPDHQQILGAIYAEHEAGHRVDPTTIAGQVAITSPARVLADCMGSCSSTTAAASIAVKIADHAALRRVQALALEAIDLIDANHAADPAHLIDHVGAGLAGIDLASDTRTIDGFWTAEQMMAADFPEPAAVVPGFLSQEDRVMVVGLEGYGKALALDTRVPIPEGWTTMGELAPGDIVYAPDGMPTEVEWVSQIHHDRPCYRITFDDGTTVVADAEHEWVTQDLRQRTPGLKVGGTYSTVTTRHMAENLRARDGHAVNFSIDVCQPLAGIDTPDFDAYTLGAWLGDGTSANATITCADEEIVERIQSAGYTVTKTSAQYRYAISLHDAVARAVAYAEEMVAQGASVRYAERHLGLPRGTLNGWRARPDRERQTGTWSVTGSLRDLGVLNNKHIPPVYLRAASHVRLALLQGIMDTDGHVAQRNSQCEITLTNERLATDALELVRSLGIKATMKESDATLDGKVVGRRWRISFQTDMPVAHLPRKAERLVPLRTQRSRRRYVVAVDPVPSVPVRCIGVAHPSHQFLVTDAFAPTHNSTLLRQWTSMVAHGVHPFQSNVAIPPQTTLLVDLENPERVIRAGLRAMKAQPPNMHILARPGGIDLRSRRDRSLLHRVCERIQPRLITIGPLYKMHRPGKGENDEDAAIAVQGILDELRIRFGCALLIEHHAPKGSDVFRKLVPFGSSAWLRWPEFGWQLIPYDEVQDMPSERGTSLQLGAFRGDRVAIDKPSHFYRSNVGWQWLSYWPDGAPRYEAHPA